MPIIMQMLISGRFGPARMVTMLAKWQGQVPTVLEKIVSKAERYIKKDYLRRGGSFRPKKADGYAWLKNPTKWLRFGRGELTRSWFSQRPTRVAGGWQAVLSSRSVYARIHEYGGVTGRNYSVTLPPRPYIKPMLSEHREEFKDDIGNAIKVTLQ